ncbi:hypothetical protein PG988_005633 [Apiospora saccharicola]
MVINPAQVDLERYMAAAATAEERPFIETNRRFYHDLWSTLGTLSAFRPRKLRAAAWIYEFLRPMTWGNADRVWTPERDVTWVMMQWIPGVHASLAAARTDGDHLDRRDGWHRQAKLSSAAEDGGKQQCADLCSRFPHHDEIAHLVASPMHRTIYTYLLSFASVVVEAGKVITALFDAQELSLQPCDHGSAPAKWQAEFSDKVLSCSRFTRRY